MARIQQRRKSNPGSNLVRGCIEFLHLHGIYCWRSNNMGTFDAKLGRCRKFNAYGARKGIADILGLLAPSGRLLAVEVKFGAGKVSADQRAFLASVGQAGGLALVVRSIDGLADALHAEGVIE